MPIMVQVNPSRAPTHLFAFPWLPWYDSNRYSEGVASMKAWQRPRMKVRIAGKRAHI